MKQLINIFLLLLMGLQFHSCSQQENQKESATEGKNTISADVTNIDDSLADYEILVSKHNQQCILDSLLKRHFRHDYYVVSGTKPYIIERGDCNKLVGKMPRCVLSAIEKSQFSGYIFDIQVTVNFYSENPVPIKAYCFLTENKYHVFFGYINKKQK